MAILPSKLQQAADRRLAAIAELGLVNALLEAVLKFAQQSAVNGTGGDGVRRTVFRAFFAMLEGLLYHMRQVTLATCDLMPLATTEADMAILRETRFTVDEKGRPKVRDEFQPFLPMLRFTLQAFARNCGATFSVTTGDQGWAAMLRATEVRNRVTHPKAKADLVVSDDDAQALVDASAWWKANLTAMFDACDAVLNHAMHPHPPTG